jgi:hypothetical protein
MLRAARDPMAGAPRICRKQIQKKNKNFQLCAAVWIPRPVREVLTFIVFIASWACSMVSIASHSVVCGRRSWLTISILSSDNLMELRASVMSSSTETRDGERRTALGQERQPR